MTIPQKWFEKSVELSSNESQRDLKFMEKKTIESRQYHNDDSSKISTSIGQKMFSKSTFHQNHKVKCSPF